MTRVSIVTMAVALGLAGATSSVFAVESLTHVAGKGHDLDEVSVGFIDLFYFNSSGLLLQSSAFHGLSESAVINLDGTTVMEEFEVSVQQCDPNPTCDFPVNCVELEPGSILVDLTWEGVGEIQQTSTNHVNHGEPHDDLIVDHTHQREESRDAIVTGFATISFDDTELDFELEGIGLLSESIVQSNIVGEPECESDEC